MKKILAFLLILSSFVACNNNKGDEPPSNQDTMAIAGRPYWEVTDTGELAIIYHEDGGPASLTADSVVAFFNRSHENVQLVLSKVSNDTVFIKIPESTYLTQQMGSSGARTTLGDAVFNLTAIPGIRYVDFDFEIGDHAMPGTMTRESFREL
jgi:hypothetical protein